MNCEEGGQGTGDAMLRARAFMDRFLPTCPQWLRFPATLFIGVVVVFHGNAQEETEEEPEPEEEIADVIKQLVFIDEHFDTNEGGSIERLKQPYDVKVDPTGSHVYVASQQDDAVSVFSRNASDGTLTFVSDIDEVDIGENALNGARSIAISPDSKFVYVVSMFARGSGSQGGNLSFLSRNESTGSLSYIESIYDSDPGVDGLDGARSVAISPDGKNLYVAAYEDDKVSAFSRNSTTGVASFLGVYEEGDQGVEELSEPHAIAVSPDGQNVYVALFKNQIVAFDRDDTNGLLSYRSKLAYLEAENGLNPSGTPRAIAISPDGAFVYVTSWNTDSLSVFSRDAESGDLTHDRDYLNNQDGTLRMDSPHSLVISADGNFVYVAAFSSDAVTSFQRDTETGSLDYFQSIYSGTDDTWQLNGPLSIAASPNGEHVYVGSGSGDHSLSTFRREVLVDPPEFVVQPIDRSIEEGESVTFHALAQGEEVIYQWYRNDTYIPGGTMPVFTIEVTAPSDNSDNYKVIASNSGGQLTSDTATLTVLPPIEVEAPTDLTALDISSNSTNIVWTDQSTNETSFEIQRRVTGGEFAAIATVLANESQYVDTTLESSTSYRYRVAAKRNDNYSAWSNDAAIESLDDIPQAPANLRLTEASYNRVRIRWSDRSAVEDGYKIYRRRDDVGSDWALVAATDANTNTYQDREVIANENYAYRVRAFNESGDSDYSNSIVAITNTIPVDSISPIARSVPKEDVSGYSLSVNSTREWEAVPSVSWLVVTSPEDGFGFENQPVTYRALLNEAQGERTGTIVVGGLDHTVTQAGSPPFIRVLPTQSEVLATDTSTNITIESNLEWTATEDADWLSIGSGSSGTNYGFIQVVIEPNETFDVRSTTVQINDISHVVRQAAAIESFEISSSDTTFNSEGGTGEVQITSNIEWSASVSKEWITVTSSVSGTGNALLNFSVAQNPLNEERTAELHVNGDSISIAQEASEVIQIFEISTQDTTFPGQGGNGEVTVTANIPWNASVVKDWITLTGATSGTENGTIGFQVQPNFTFEDRTAEMIVNEEILAITQEAIATTDISAPTLTDTDISSGLGVELSWTDNSSTENGFFIRRAIAGNNAFELIAEVAANQTSYFDRNAPRGKSLVYRLSAFDNIGRSNESAMSTGKLPASNLTMIAGKATFGENEVLSYARFSLAGEGRMTLTTTGFGKDLSRIPLGGARLIRVDSSIGEPVKISASTAINWEAVFGTNYATLIDSASESIEYGIKTEASSNAFARGLAVTGVIDETNRAIAVGFEIVGDITLPILIRGIGPSLSKQGTEIFITNPRVELYEIESDGTAAPYSENNDWAAWTKSTKITLQDALAKANSSVSDLKNREAIILEDLPAGRYVCVVLGEGSSVGSVMLSVFDAR